MSEDEGEEYDEELEAGVNLKHCSVSHPHNLTLTEALRIARTFCTHKASRSYSPSPYDLPNAFLPPLDTEEEWEINRILPLAQTPLLHAPDHITILRTTREALASDTELLTFRSPEHGDSIVHMYPLQCTLRNIDIGAVLDTGAQRSAAKYSEEILEPTHSSHTMQGAFGKPTTMKGILMGCATVDIKGIPLTIVIPDESVFDPLLSDSLVSTGRLMEAGFEVIFRLPKDAGTDGFHPDKYPLYGGTILTPENPPRTIIIEYRDHTWRLPVPQLRVPEAKQYLIDTRNSFTPLSRAPAALSLTCIPEITTSVRSDMDQHKFELMCSRQKQAQILHESGGHRNARDTYRDLEAAGMKVHHLKKYILAHQCKWCQANLGRKAYHCQKARQQGGDLEISTIIDPLNPKIMLTETLAKIHQITIAPDHPAWSMEGCRKEACETEKVTKKVPLGILEAHTHKDLTKLKAFAQALLPDPIVAPEEPGVQNHSPAGTDLRIDWADACSLGRNGERYFLLIVDKGTEYLANFNTKTRQSPVALLQAYITATGKTPRFLRVDGAKEFVSDEMVTFCTSEKIILQVVVAYNHTMQARVEGAIGYVKQHGRVSMLAANVPTRWWPQATTDFINKKNFLWYSADLKGSLTTAHQRMRPAFAGTRATVAIPFGSRIVSTIPREHRLVVNGSFGDRFVEGIYLHADHATPTIRMYDFGSRSEISVQDFKSYPDEFPFRDQSCLMRPSQNLTKDMLTMHAEDSADDALIAEELGHHAVTRSQSQAMERATHAPFIVPPISPLGPLPQTTVLEPDIVCQSKPMVIPKRTALILRETPELELAREFVRLSYPVTLPQFYSPPDLPIPKGKMVVVAIRAQKQSSSKAVVWVKFLSPPSHVGKQIQLYPKSLEPKNGPAKGQDFSLLSALELSHPGAKTWTDLGVTTTSTSKATEGMLAALQAYNGGTRFSAEEVSATGAETSESNPILLQESSDEHYSPQAPEGYTRGMQDPKHRGSMLRSPLKPSWLVAEKAEMDGLYRRKCWVKVLRSSLTPQDKIFSTRFHYKIKRKDGQFEKCKVRLVIQGQHMRRKDETGFGDFEDAFSPVPHASGFRTILSLATQHNMLCDHVDISQAFVQGDLLPGDGHNGKVYISPPPGFTEDNGYVYQLRRPLYGMPSAARAWHTTMSAYLKSQGCSLVGFERSMWCATIGGHTILIAAHIDDFILACSDRTTLDTFRTGLLARFDGTYEGAVHTYLGCEIERDIAAGRTLLSQRHFAEDVLRTFEMWDCVPALTPMRPGTRLTKDQSDLSPDLAFHRRYRGIVGSLGYLVNMTRPDLAWSYSELSKYVQYPGKAHMDAALHVLRYLRGTYDQAILYQHVDELADTLWGWVDSDWAADVDSRRSHTGYIIMLNGGAVSWKSRRQDCVSLSTSEAEYVAASQCGQEVFYMREILRDFGYTQIAPTRIYEDNLACVAMSENPVRRKFSRHIDIRRFFVRDMVTAGILKLVPLRTHLMVADALTKSLPSPAHIKHREIMLGHVPFAARTLRNSVKGG